MQYHSIRAGTAREAFRVAPLASTALAVGLGILGFACAPEPGAAGPARKPNPVFAPVEDVEGLPRVLLIGDSISMGYTLPVRELLKGKANVHRPPTNCGDTKRGLASMKAWLGEKPWDVIHFNWGLHDLKYLEEKQNIPIAEYEANLREIVKLLKATGAKLIWCSTTPVPEGNLNPMRKNDDVKAYNAAARKVMEENEIAIDDLYAFAEPQLAQIQIPVNVHFTADGSKVLAKQVAARLEPALPKK